MMDFHQQGGRGPRRLPMSYVGRVNYVVSLVFLTSLLDRHSEVDHVEEVKIR